MRGKPHRTEKWAEDRIGRQEAQAKTLPVVPSGKRKSSRDTAAHLLGAATWNQDTTRWQGGASGDLHSEPPGKAGGQLPSL